ncbi:unnamed protein product [Nezara viridula]|uniref:Uncharacterized protein n=1 Tax=Nezara viridula TaxID=85310 RepID=A0A9P0HCH6_NEZVI|nr:unnamed protein product [Nezara viridula]
MSETPDFPFRKSSENSNIQPILKASDATNATRSSSAEPPRPLFADCQVAQEAVTNSTGRDIKGTVDNLTKAFQHSKSCTHCADHILSSLEKFVSDVHELKRTLKSDRRSISPSFVCP